MELFAAGFSVVNESQAYGPDTTIFTKIAEGNDIRVLFATWGSAVCK